MNALARSGVPETELETERQDIQRRGLECSAALHEGNKRVCALNKRYFNRFKEVLSPEQWLDFEKSVLAKAYPLIHPFFSDPRPLLHLAMKKLDLTEAEANHVATILATYGTAYETACSEMEARHDEWMEVIGPQETSPQADRAGYKADMLKLHNRRKASAKAAMTALKQLIGEERLAALPGYVKYVRMHRA